MFRIGWLVGALGVAGCWSSPDLIDGAFTPEQWAKLQDELVLKPAPDPCALAKLDASRCLPAKQLAQALFGERALSCAPPPAGTPLTPCSPISCADCHDAKNGFIDSRTPDNVSLCAAQGASPRCATGRTKHNAMSLLDLGYKQQLGAGRTVFTWIGQYTTAGDVFELAIKTPMASNPVQVAQALQANGGYVMLYTAAFGPPNFGDPTKIFANLKIAFDAYLTSSEFQTQPTPFDSWMLGQPSTMSDSAKRGFAIFVGKGTCIECHNGQLFSDLDFHDTGVPQKGENVPATDLGRSMVTNDPADDGKFLTGMLREISATGPYMHDGTFERLGDVIEFYREGGVAEGYSGTRDPRITPLDITDDDAHDLEAFLRSLSDSDCDDGNTSKCPQPRDAGIDAPPDSRPPPPPPPPGDGGLMCMPGFLACGPICVDPTIDPMNCGSCGNACVYPNTTCVMGTCRP